MIVTFANLKGGAGKTTLATALANYLVLEHGKTVHVFDCDAQRPLFRTWEEDNRASGRPVLYKVESMNGKNEARLADDGFLNALGAMDDICLFDTEHAVSDKYLRLFCHSHAIAVPFEYSSADMLSAVRFINALKMMEKKPEAKPNAKIIFLKNNMRTDEDHPLKDMMDIEFNRHGRVMAHAVNRHRSLLRVGTGQLSYEQKLAVKPCFEEIIYNLWN